MLKYADQHTIKGSRSGLYKHCCRREELMEINCVFSKKIHQNGCPGRRVLFVFVCFSFSAPPRPPRRAKRALRARARCERARALRTTRRPGRRFVVRKQKRHRQMLTRKISKNKFLCPTSNQSHSTSFVKTMLWGASRRLGGTF